MRAGVVDTVATPVPSLGQMNIEEVVLEGEFVRLEPLRARHLGALTAAGLDPAIWNWTANVAEHASDISRYADAAMADASSGIALPFVTIDKLTSTVVGSTRFGNIDPANRKAEIGWTWINPRWQRTGINSEAKPGPPAAGGRRGRNFAQPHDHRIRPIPGFGLFQYH